MSEKDECPKLREWVNKFGSVILLFLGLTYFIICCIFNTKFIFRLDQYASTISGTIIGVVGTMFGLTAASYAFVWGELKSEGESNPRLAQILIAYKSKLWTLFFNSLILTFSIIGLNLLLLGGIQCITDPTLYYSESGTIADKNVIINTYYNENYDFVTLCVLIDLTLSIFNVLLMAELNYEIFNRKRSYEKIAIEKLHSLEKNYNLELTYEDSKEEIDKFKLQNYDINAEFNKIHYLELLVNRILKNHESEGDVYSYVYNEEKLLEQIVCLKVSNSKFDMKDIINTKELFDLREKSNCQGSDTKGKKPVDVEFSKVYSDLILYRNAQLVFEDTNIRGTMLKCTIKKRLLILFMSYERFDGMDLANVSLSGADLSYSNFSNCNLKGVRLKGTNCLGTDFSNSRMPGMHFPGKLSSNNSKNNANNDDIVITNDSNVNGKWNVYTVHMPTCLEKATFANADISRMTLLADGEFDNSNNFPFDNDKIMVIENKTPFSLRDVNFDCAKLFSAMFNNIDLSQASIFKAQMFNSELILVNSPNVNFSETVLTYSIIKYSSFVRSNFQKSVISNCNICRSDFSYTNLSESNFSNSKINNCNFKNAICNCTSFKNITCDNKEVNICISFEYATMRDADFSNANLFRVDFSHANVLNCIFTSSDIKNGNFFYTVLSSTIWNSSKIKDSKFISAVMRDGVFLYAEFFNCCFKNTDFSNSIVNCKFVEGTMDHVKFCNVKGLNPNLFKHIKLNYVDFTGCGVAEKDFSHGVVLNNCIFDNKGDRRYPGNGRNNKQKKHTKFHR